MAWTSLLFFPATSLFQLYLSALNCCFSSVLSIGSMLERLVLKKYVECTSRRVQRTSGAQVVKTELELSLTSEWRTWTACDRRVMNLNYLWPTRDELELSLTDVWRTWSIFDRRVTNLCFLWPACDKLKLHLWRTWAILGLWVSDFHEVRLDVSIL